MLRIIALLLGVVLLFFVVHWLFGIDFYAAATYAFGKIGNISLVESLIALERMLFRWALGSAPIRILVLAVITYLGLRKLKNEWHKHVGGWYKKHHHWRAIKYWDWFTTWCGHHGISLRLVFMMFVVWTLMWLVIWGVGIYFVALFFPRESVAFVRFVWRYTGAVVLEFAPNMGLNAFTVKIWERTKRTKVARVVVRIEGVLEERVSAPIEAVGLRHREYVRTHPRIGKLVGRFARRNKGKVFIPKPLHRQLPPKAVHNEEKKKSKPKKTHTARLLEHYSNTKHNNLRQQARSMNYNVRRHNPTMRR